MSEYLPNDGQTAISSGSSAVYQSAVHKSHGNPEQFLKINVGGRSFLFRGTTLTRQSQPRQTLLHEFAQKTHEERLEVADAFLSDTAEYFFERPPEIFLGIYDYLTTGNLHKTGFVCTERFALELDFWRVPRSLFSSDCSCSDLDHSSIQQSLIDHNENSNHEPLALMEKSRLGNLGSFIELKDDYENLFCAKQRRRLSQFFEDPSSSLAAKIFAVVSVGFVVASIGALILGSLPELQVEQISTVKGEKLEKVPHPSLIYTEYACIAWFCAEYIFRFVVAPKKLEFVRSPLNVIDLLTIVPFWIELCLSLSGAMGSEKLRKFQGTMLVIRILRVLRVARVFRLARYSSGLKSFGETVKNSLTELGMLALFLLTGIIFFSTVIYFLEKDEDNTKFTSIPAACWWCIVTMTTVGYGDVVPSTIGGKLVASVASISGVLVLAFPITMIVDNFARNYDKEDPEPQPAAKKRRRRTTSFI